MVCVPCIVVPVLLWIWHKFIQPYVLKFWNPWGSKSVEKSMSDGTIPSDVDTNSKEYQYIETTIKTYPVVMFSKSTCKFCKMARDLFTEVAVDYHEEEIAPMENCQAIQDLFQKLTGERTVPRVYIGGKCVGGGSDVWNLHNQGKLLPMLKEAGADVKTDTKKDK